MNDIDTRDALTRAAGAFGGFAELAKRLHVTRQAVSAWRQRGCVPAERVIEIERLTGVSRYDLRPDIYPQENRS